MGKSGEVYQTVSFHIQGMTPHVQHNGQLANTRNWYARQMSLLHGKRNKTDEDYDQLQTLEWEGGLYLDPNTKRVVVPGLVLEGALWEAGKKRRLGPKIRAGIISRGYWPLVFPGCDRTVEELRDDPDFRDVRVIRNPSTGARLVRCRPVFREWELQFELQYRPDMLSYHQLYDVVRILGEDIGFSDDRTRTGGRFDILAPSKPSEDPAVGKPKPKSRKKSEDGEPVNENGEPGNGDGEHQEPPHSEGGYVPFVSDFDPEPEPDPELDPEPEPEEG